MGRLNWQNATATLLTGLIVVIYVFFLEGTSLRLISTRGGVIAVVLALGFGAWVLYAQDFEAQRQAKRDFAGSATTIEGVTLMAAVIGLITQHGCTRGPCGWHACPVADRDPTARNRPPKPAGRFEGSQVRCLRNKA